MSCPDEVKLIRLIAGDCDPEAEAVLREHLAGCPKCAGVIADLKATWELLEAGREGGEGQDLWPAIQAAMERGEGDDVRRWFPHSTMEIVRAAASVAIALGLGWAAGGFVGRPAQNAGGTVEEIPVEQVIESLGLDEFASTSATGLHATLTAFEEEQSNPEAGS